MCDRCRSCHDLSPAVESCGRCGGCGEEPDADGYVNLGEVARRLCGMQAQYASRYLTGGAHAQLGEGLRVDLSGYEHGGDYHAIRIHAADARELARRIATQCSHA